ncbi:TPA: hypothetical protein ACM275_004677, partial [Escherichia coli]
MLNGHQYYYAIVALMDKCALTKAVISVNITLIVLFRPAPPQQDPFISRQTGYHHSGPDFFGFFSGEPPER